MDVIKKGALGTTNMYYTAVDPLPEEEIPGMIKHLRKEIWRDDNSKLSAIENGSFLTELSEVIGF